MHIAFFSDFRAVSELRNLEVLNLAMCTGVTITGICSLVKGGKNSRCMFIKKTYYDQKKCILNVRLYLKNRFSAAMGLVSKRS